MYPNEITLDDINELGQRVAARERRMKAYEDIIEAVSDAIISIDHRGLVRVWNPAAEVMFGWSQDETLDQPLIRFVMDAEFWDAHIMAVKRVVESGECSPNTRRGFRRKALRKDGSKMLVDLRGHNLLRVVAVIREVTDGTG